MKAGLLDYRLDVGSNFRGKISQAAQTKKRLMTTTSKISENSPKRNKFDTQTKANSLKGKATISKDTVWIYGKCGN